MENFKVGDVVYLKSGSLPMTIRTITQKNAFVTWHDQNGEHNSAYPFDAITKVNPYSNEFDEPKSKVGF